MQVATTINKPDGVIVKRVSVPVGLEEIMEGLTKEVLLKKPKDLYKFAHEYFSRLLSMRQEKELKERVHTARSAIRVEGFKPKPSERVAPRRQPAKQLSRQLNVRNEEISPKIDSKEPVNKSKGTTSSFKSQTKIRNISTETKQQKKPIGNDLSKKTGSSSNQSTPRDKISKDRKRSSSRESTKSKASDRLVTTNNGNLQKEVVSDAAKMIPVVEKSEKSEINETIGLNQDSNIHSEPDKGTLENQNNNTILTSIEEYVGKSEATLIISIDKEHQQDSKETSMSNDNSEISTNYDNERNKDETCNASTSAGLVPSVNTPDKKTDGEQQINNLKNNVRGPDFSQNEQVSSDSQEILIANANLDSPTNCGNEIIRTNSLNETIDKGLLSSVDQTDSRVDNEENIESDKVSENSVEETHSDQNVKIQIKNADDSEQKITSNLLITSETHVEPELNSRVTCKMLDNEKQLLKHTSNSKNGAGSVKTPPDKSEFEKNIESVSLSDDKMNAKFIFGPKSRSVSFEKKNNVLHTEKLMEIDSNLQKKDEIKNKDEVAELYASKNDVSFTKSNINELNHILQTQKVIETDSTQHKKGEIKNKDEVAAVSASINDVSSIKSDLIELNHISPIQKIIKTDSNQHEKGEIKNKDELAQVSSSKNDVDSMKINLNEVNHILHTQKVLETDSNQQEKGKIENKHEVTSKNVLGSTKSGLNELNYISHTQKLIETDSNHLEKAEKGIRDKVAEVTASKNYVNSQKLIETNSDQHEEGEKVTASQNDVNSMKSELNELNHISHAQELIENDSNRQEKHAIEIKNDVAEVPASKNDVNSTKSGINELGNENNIDNKESLLDNREIVQTELIPVNMEGNELVFTAGDGNVLKDPDSYLEKNENCDSQSRVAENDRSKVDMTDGTNESNKSSEHVPTSDAPLEMRNNSDSDLFEDQLGGLHASDTRIADIEGDRLNYLKEDKRLSVDNNISTRSHAASSLNTSTKNDIVKFIEGEQKYVFVDKHQTVLDKVNTVVNQDISVPSSSDSKTRTCSITNDSSKKFISNTQPHARENVKSVAENKVDDKYCGSIHDIINISANIGSPNVYESVSEVSDSDLALGHARETVKSVAEHQSSSESIGISSEFLKSLPENKVKDKDCGSKNHEINTADANIDSGENGTTRTNVNESVVEVPDSDQVLDHLVKSEEDKKSEIISDSGSDPLSVEFAKSNGASSNKKDTMEAGETLEHIKAKSNYVHIPTNNALKEIDIEKFIDSERNHVFVNSQPDIREQQNGSQIRTFEQISESFDQQSQISHVTIKQCTLENAAARSDLTDVQLESSKMKIYDARSHESELSNNILVNNRDQLSITNNELAHLEQSNISETRAASIEDQQLVPKCVPSINKRQSDVEIGVVKDGKVLLTRYTSQDKSYDTPSHIKKDVNATDVDINENPVEDEESPIISEASGKASISSPVEKQPKLGRDIKKSNENLDLEQQSSAIDKLMQHVSKTGTGNTETVIQKQPPDFVPTSSEKIIEPDRQANNELISKFIHNEQLNVFRKSVEEIVDSRTSYLVGEGISSDMTKVPNVILKNTVRFPDDDGNKQTEIPLEDNAEAKTMENFNKQEDITFDNSNNSIFILHEQKNALSSTFKPSNHLNRVYIPLKPHSDQAKAASKHNLEGLHEIGNETCLYSENGDNANVLLKDNIEDDQKILNTKSSPFDKSSNMNFILNEQNNALPNVLEPNVEENEEKGIYIPLTDYSVAVYILKPNDSLGTSVATNTLVPNVDHNQARHSDVKDPKVTEKNIKLLEKLDIRPQAKAVNNDSNPSEINVSEDGSGEVSEKISRYKSNEAIISGNNLVASVIKPGPSEGHLDENGEKQSVNNRDENKYQHEPRIPEKNTDTKSTELQKQNGKLLLDSDPLESTKDVNPESIELRDENEEISIPSNQSLRTNQFNETAESSAKKIQALWRRFKFRKDAQKAKPLLASKSSNEEGDMSPAMSDSVTNGIIRMQAEVRGFLERQRYNRVKRESKIGQVQTSEKENDTLPAKPMSSDHIVSPLNSDNIETMVSKLDPKSLGRSISVADNKDHAGKTVLICESVKDDNNNCKSEPDIKSQIKDAIENINNTLSNMEKIKNEIISSDTFNDLKNKTNAQVETRTDFEEGKDQIQIHDIQDNENVHKALIDYQERTTDDCKSIGAAMEPKSIKPLNIEADKARLDALKGHVDLIDEVQNQILDQIAGKTSETKSKYDIDQLRQELEEATALYKDLDNFSDIPFPIDHNDELLQYLSSFDSEPSAKFDLLVKKPRPMGLPNITEEDTESKTDLGDENIVHELAVAANTNVMETGINEVRNDKDSDREKQLQLSQENDFSGEAVGSSMHIEIRPKSIVPHIENTSLNVLQEIADAGAIQTDISLDDNGGNSHSDVHLDKNAIDSTSSNKTDNDITVSKSTNNSRDDSFTLHRNVENICSSSMNATDSNFNLTNNEGEVVPNQTLPQTFDDVNNIEKGNSEIKSLDFGKSSAAEGESTVHDVNPNEVTSEEISTDIDVSSNIKDLNSRTENSHITNILESSPKSEEQEGMRKENTSKLSSSYNAITDKTHYQLITENIHSSLIQNGKCDDVDMKTKVSDSNEFMEEEASRKIRDSDKKLMSSANSQNSSDSKTEPESDIRNYNSLTSQDRDDPFRLEKQSTVIERKVPIKDLTRIPKVMTKTNSVSPRTSSTKDNSYASRSASSTTRVPITRKSSAELQNARKSTDNILKKSSSFDEEQSTTRLSRKGSSRNLAKIGKQKTIQQTFRSKEIYDTKSKDKKSLDGKDQLKRMANKDNKETAEASAFQDIDNLNKNIGLELQRQPTIILTNKSTDHNSILEESTEQVIHPSTDHIDDDNSKNLVDHESKEHVNPSIETSAKHQTDQSAEKQSPVDQRMLVPASTAVNREDSIVLSKGARNVKTDSSESPCVEEELHDSLEEKIQKFSPTNESLHDSLESNDKNEQNVPQAEETDAVTTVEVKNMSFVNSDDNVRCEEEHEACDKDTTNIVDDVSFVHGDKNRKIEGNEDPMGHLNANQEEKDNKVYRVTFLPEEVNKKIDDNFTESKISAGLPETISVNHKTVDNSNSSMVQQNVSIDNEESTKNVSKPKNCLQETNISLGAIQHDKTSLPENLMTNNLVPDITITLGNCAERKETDNDADASPHPDGDTPDESRLSNGSHENPGVENGEKSAPSFSEADQNEQLPSTHHGEGSESKQSIVRQSSHSRLTRGTRSLDSALNSNEAQAAPAGDAAMTSSSIETNRDHAVNDVRVVPITRAQLKPDLNAKRVKHPIVYAPENREKTNASSPSQNMASGENTDSEKKNEHVLGNNEPQTENMEAEAATRIQAGFRGYQVRRQLKLKHESDKKQPKKRDSSKNKPEEIEEKSAVKIQAGVRGFLVRRRHKKNTNSTASA